MRRNPTKKGFTIVELIIVIAVIGVLAAILIPTFSTVINKANYADRQSAVKNMNTAVISETEGMEKVTPLTMNQAIEAIESAGFSEESFKTAKKGYDIVWIGQVGKTVLNRFALVRVNEDTQIVEDVVYPSEAIEAVAQMPLSWRNTSNLQSISIERKTSIADCDWTKDERIALTADETITSSHYLRGNWALDLNGHTLNLGYYGDTYVTGSISISDSVGTGKIQAAGAQLWAFSNGTITVNSGTVTTSHNQYAVLAAGISGNQTASKSLITINGGVVSATGGAPAITVFSKDAQLDVYGGTISAVNRFSIAGNGSSTNGGTIINIYGGSITSSDSPAIYHPQAGVLNISGGTIKSVLSSSESTHIADAINIKSGTINISGGIISSETHALTMLEEAYGNGSESAGSAVGIVSHNSYAGNVVVNITGGSFKSAEGYAFSQLISPGSESAVASISITGGTFHSTKGIRVTEGTNITIDIKNVTAVVEGLS